MILRANMEPRTVKHALKLLKMLLPPENTLPTTVDELFGAMLSCNSNSDRECLDADFDSSGK